MNKIRAIRETGGVSQAALFRRLGWSQTRLSNYEKGIRTPGLEESRLIVAALQALGCECSLDDVFPPATDLPTLPVAS